jgi:hypothetical protein
MPAVEESVGYFIDARAEQQPDTNADANRLVGTVRYAELLDASDQVQRHGRDFTGVFQTWPR